MIFRHTRKSNRGNEGGNKRKNSRKSRDGRLEKRAADESVKGDGLSVIVIVGAGNNTKENGP